MPKVPIYERQVKDEVMPTVRSSANATADSFGARQGRGIERMGQAMQGASNLTQKIAIEMQNKKNKSLVSDAYNGFQEASRDSMALLYRKQGKDAMETKGVAHKELGEMKKKHIQMFTGNRVAQEMLASSIDPLVQRHLDRAMTHQETNIIKFDQATRDADNGNAIKNAVVARWDEGEIADSEATIRQNIIASTKGFEGPARKKAIADGVHLLHKDVLSAHVADSPKVGLAYLEKYWKKFDPKLRSEMKAELLNKVEDEWVRDKSMSFDGLPYNAALKKIDKIVDADKQKKVMTHYKARFKNFEDIESIQTKKAENKQADIIYTSYKKAKKNPLQFMEELKNYNAPMAMDFKEQKKLNDLAAKLYKEVKSANGVGKSTMSDKATLQRLARLNHNELGKEDLLSLQLSAGDFGKYLKKQTEEERYIPETQMMNTLVKGMDKFNVKEEGDEASIRVGKLRGSLHGVLDSLKPQERTTDKVRETVQELLAPAAIEDGGFLWFDKPIMMYERDYIEDDKERVGAFKYNVPENLQGYGDGLKFDDSTKRYYVDGDGVRRVFDQYGKQTKQYQLNIKAENK